MTKTDVEENFKLTGEGEGERGRFSQIEIIYNLS